MYKTKKKKKIKPASNG